MGSDYSYYKFEINISNSKFKKKPTKEELEEEKQRKENERKAVEKCILTVGICPPDLKCVKVRRFHFS